MGLRDHPVVETALAVQKRDRDDGARYLAAGITYYAFLSLFPLLLLGMSVIGFVLAGDPAAQRDLAARLAESVPGLQATIGGNLEALVSARGVTGALGIAGLLWTGTGMTEAAGHALSRVFRFEPHRKFLRKKRWSLGTTAGLGLLAMAGLGAGAAVTNLPVGGAAAVGVGVAGPVVTLGLDLALFTIGYWVLAQRKAPSRVWPGALLAAAGWTVLKIFGSWYAVRTVQGSTAVYGTFASTLGILVILYLASRIFLYGAELNAVLADRSGEGKAEPLEELRAA